MFNLNAINPQDLLPIFNCFSLYCLTQSSTGRRSSLLRERSTLEEPVDKLEANKKGEEKEPFYGREMQENT